MRMQWFGQVVKWLNKTNLMIQTRDTTNSGEKNQGYRWDVGDIQNPPSYKEKSATVQLREVRRTCSRKASIRSPSSISSWLSEWASAKEKKITWNAPRQEYPPSWSSAPRRWTLMSLGSFNILWAPERIQSANLGPCQTFSKQTSRVILTA